MELVRIAAIKDGDGDYWLPYGVEGQDRICLTREGTVDGLAVSPDLMAVSEYGPFAAVTIEVKELPDPALTCDACLRDMHFCYQCDDAVEHGHRHEEG